MSFTADDARAFLATCRTPARCTRCGAADPPTRMTLVGDPEDVDVVSVHDGCAGHSDATPAIVTLGSRKLLDTDRAAAACEAVIALTALTAQLAAAEAEAGRLRAQIAAEREAANEFRASLRPAPFALNVDLDAIEARANAAPGEGDFDA